MYMPDGHIRLLFYIHAEQYQKKRICHKEHILFPPLINKS